MLDSLLASLSLLTPSGVAILCAIFVLLTAGVTVTLTVRARYGRLARDLSRNADASAASFDSALLNDIVREALDAQRTSAEVNTQAIIDHHFQARLHALLVGERFVKATTGLMIILGLVGTFYGLTMSIGKLVALVSGDMGKPEEITQSLTTGLTEALAGMSVAFSSSLFGILAAIVMTLLGVFLSISDRRTALMAQIETYLDNVLLAHARAAGGFESRGPGGEARFEHALAAFGQSVGRLDAMIGRFESALGNFASSSRDFREFNHHLKDNIQRMSLSFGDLSQALAREAELRRPRDGR